MNKSETIQHAYVVSHVLESDEQFPNNQKLPLLIYKGALFLHPNDDADVVEQIFEKNGWTNSWVAGIFNYHHYHTTTHEVLGIVCGKADVQFGGPEGVCVEVQRGDVVIIPAGVAHKCNESSADFSCVGAYPNGSDYDMNYGKEGERPAADDRIGKVALPEKDPVYGDGGSLKECWVE